MAQGFINLGHALWLRVLSIWDMHYGSGFYQSGTCIMAQGFINLEHGLVCACTWSARGVHVGSAN